MPLPHSLTPPYSLPLSLYILLPRPFPLIGSLSSSLSPFPHPFPRPLFLLLPVNLNLNLPLSPSPFSPATLGGTVAGIIIAILIVAGILVGLCFHLKNRKRNFGRLSDQSQDDSVRQV